MLQNPEQLGCRHCHHGQRIVEAERVGNVELGNLALLLADFGVGRRRIFRGAAADGRHIADRVANAAAVLDRNQYSGIGLLGVPEIGVRREVSKIGFLGADFAATAFQVDIGIAEHIAVLHVDDVADALSNVVHQIALAAFGERVGIIGIDVAIAVDVNDVIIKIGDHFIGGGIGAADIRIDAAGDDVAVGVEINHQPAHIGVFARSIDDQRGIAVRVLRHDRVAAGRGVAGVQRVLPVGQQRMRSACDDDVHTMQQRRKRLLQSKLLEVADQDDLVDPLGNQAVDGRLQDGGQGHHVIDIVADHIDAAGRGDALDDLGCRADHADPLAALLDDGRRCDLLADAGRRREAGIVVGVQDRICVEPGEVRITGKIQIGREIRELGPREARGLPDDRRERIGASVEFVVADCRGLNSDDVQHRDIGRAEAGRDVQGTGREAVIGLKRGLIDFLQRRVAAGAEERAGNEIVARRQRDRVLERLFQIVDHGREIAGAVDRIETRLEIRRMQDLQGVDQGDIILVEIEADDHRIVVGDTDVGIGIEDRRITSEIGVVVQRIRLVGVDVPGGHTCYL